MPAGGAGIRGWLSASYIKLTAIAAALAATLPVSIQNVGQKLMAASLGVTIASDQRPIKIRATSSSTGTQSTVPAQTANTNPILAANANRIGSCVFNDSTSVLYLLTATGTRSSTNYTVQVPANGYFSDTDYTGIVQGVWAVANGNARVTEMT